jgi:hypothetical protein
MRINNTVCCSISPTPRDRRQPGVKPLLHYSTISRAVAEFENEMLACSLA